MANLTTTEATILRRYRLADGHCSLLRIPRSGGGWFSVVVGFGALGGEQQVGKQLRAIGADILKTTGGVVDLLIVPAARWDYLSGFVYAADLFAESARASGSKQLAVKQVLLAAETEAAAGYREAYERALADALASQRAQELADLEQRALLRGTAVGKGWKPGKDPAAADLARAGAFCGPAPGAVNGALQAVRGFAADPPLDCVRRPKPLEWPAAELRAYVLSPAQSSSAVYLRQFATAFGADLGVQLDGVGATPFDPEFRVDLALAREITFFQEHYWADRSGGKADGEDQSWRRIDSQWLRFAPALAMDSNRAAGADGLAMALELGEAGPVVVLPGPAGIAPWDEWGAVEFERAGVAITGRSLLARGRVYDGSVAADTPVGESELYLDYVVGGE